ncbi:unnamed protein product, partial [Allacma fusca]
NGQRSVSYYPGQNIYTCVSLTYTFASDLSARQVGNYVEIFGYWNEATILGYELQNISIQCHQNFTRDNDSNLSCI